MPPVSDLDLRMLQFLRSGRKKGRTGRRKEGRKEERKEGRKEGREGGKKERREGNKQVSTIKIKPLL